MDNNTKYIHTACIDTHANAYVTCIEYIHKINLPFKYILRKRVFKQDLKIKKKPRQS